MRQRNRDIAKRKGAATVEFAALLPVFVVFALLVIEVQEMMFRSMCNSHAAFSAARRWLVAGVDQGYVQAHYRAAGMRGNFSIRAETSGASPQRMTVEIRDIYNIFSPTDRSRGATPGLKKGAFSELSIRESAAGAGPRVFDSDNDL